MKLPGNKTKIVCTIGPASESPKIIEQMIQAGMPVHEPEHPEDGQSFIREWLHVHEVEGNIVALIEGPSPKHPGANNRMEIIDLGKR